MQRHPPFRFPRPLRVLALLALASCRTTTAAQSIAVVPQVIAAPYLKVLERDAADSLASMELVLAQPWISSQLIDNLNASMHLRALLTDLFLIGEVEKIRTLPAPPVLQVTDDTSSSQVGKSEMALGVNGTNGLIETIAPYND